MADLTDDALDARIREVLSGLRMDFEATHRPRAAIDSVPVQGSILRVRSAAMAMALVALLVGASLIAVSARGGSTRAVQPAVTAQLAPDAVGPAQIAPDGEALTPARVTDRVASLNGALDRCLVGHSAAKRKTPDGGVVYDDPVGKARAACRSQAAASDAYADGTEMRLAGQRRTTIRHAFGACATADPNATDRDNGVAVHSATGLFCRKLVNAAASDELLLQALITAAPEARKLRRSGDLSVRWVGRTTRASVEAAIGLRPISGAAAEQVIAVAYEGAFEARPPAGPTIENKTLVLLLRPDGHFGPGSPTVADIYITDRQDPIK